MGRVLFPTKNDIGVRTLSGISGADYAGFRAPAEPAPRGASNPVTLGVAVSTSELMFPSPPRYWGGTPIVYRPPVLPAPAPTPAASTPAPPVIAPAPVVAAPPVSQQSTPTPTVSVPPAPVVSPLVTTGGGTASPNVAPAAPAASAAAPSTGIMDSVAAWLSGSTPIGTWSVPNALLAGAVILGFAFLEGGGSTTGRKR